MARYVALLRGVNVGTAKQVPMAALKQVCDSIGWRNVATVLRSGSVVFDADAAPKPGPLEAELKRTIGVDARALVFGASEFERIAADNPLSEVSTDGSKLFVTFLEHPAGAVEVPDAAALAPELMRVASRAVYQWFPDGSTRSKVPKEFWRQLPGVQTARNANTVQRILTLLSEEDG